MMTPPNAGAARLSKRQGNLSQPPRSKAGFPNTADDAVYATVSYADVFDMPIELVHLHRYLVGHSLTMTDTSRAIDSLVSRQRLERRGDVVYLAGRSEVLDVYQDRTARAVDMWHAAEVLGRRIGRLPFVRMVAVTGGLAVDSVADHDDIDFFIVVRPHRLWLTRLMIIVLGRVAARKNIELCPNFIVSTRALEMDERSIYVARELAQMVVIVGRDVCRSVRRVNAWMFEYLPNATVEGDERHLCDISPSLVQKWAELFLLLPPFQLVEDWERNRKIAKLTRVASRRPEVGAPDESSFSTEVCKGHMVGNAAGIDRAWKQRLHPR